MSPLDNPQLVHIAARTHGTTTGEVTIRRWARQDRIVRATQALGLCWAGALVTLFIPIAHFVLVPACLLAGPAVAWHRYQQASVVLGGTGTCPACQSDLEIVRSADRWPLEELCTQCQQQVTIARAM